MLRPFSIVSFAMALYFHDNLHLFYFSGPNDHVFVNFVDHGAPGILGFGEKRVGVNGQQFCYKRKLCSF